MFRGTANPARLFQRHIHPKPWTTPIPREEDHDRHFDTPPVTFTSFQAVEYRYFARRCSRLTSHIVTSTISAGPPTGDPAPTTC